MTSLDKFLYELLEELRKAWDINTSEELDDIKDKMKKYAKAFLEEQKRQYGKETNFTPKK